MVKAMSRPPATRSERTRQRNEVQPTMEKLSLILWRERGLMETLQYRLEVEQLMMSSGQTRWLTQAARDVEQVLEQVRDTEILRAVAADEAALEVGLPVNPSLSGLIEANDPAIRGSGRPRCCAPARRPWCRRACRSARPRSCRAGSRARRGGRRRSGCG